MSNPERKSISQLEGWTWKLEVPDKENSSYEEYNFYLLHDKPIGDYSAEDVYFMIGQDSGLKYIVPMAIELLSDDLFLEADDYPGDLLQRMLSLEKSFWERNPQMYKSLYTLVKDIKLPNPDLQYYINKPIKLAWNSFMGLEINLSR